MKARHFFALALALNVLLAASPAIFAVAPPPSHPLRIAALLEQLDDDDFDVRLGADTTLRHADKSILPQLRQECGRTESLEVRKRLEGIIHHLTTDERIPDLVRQLGDSRTDFRDQADWELRQYGETVVPLLQKELSPSLDLERRKRVEKIIADLTPRK